jgi:hypothetical protein
VFEEPGHWEVVAEAQGVEPVRAVCGWVRPFQAVRLALTAVRIQRPWVALRAWRFRCRSLDGPESPPLLYRVLSGGLWRVGELPQIVSAVSP